MKLMSIVLCATVSAVSMGLGGCAGNNGVWDTSVAVRVSSTPEFAGDEATPIGVVVTDEAGRVPPGGATELETAAIQALMDRRFRLVERRHISKVLGELSFQDSGLTDADAVKLGRMTNARAILLLQVTGLQSIRNGQEGSIWVWNTDKANMVMRVIDVKTATTPWVASCQGSVTQFWRSEPMQLVKQMIDQSIAKLPAPGETATPAGAPPVATAAR